MEKLLEKLENLTKELDKNKNIIKIRQLNKELESNKELKELLENYHLNKDEQIKKEIINNSFFQEYKDCEIEINVLILEINQELKKISQKGKCSL